MTFVWTGLGVVPPWKALLQGSQSTSNAGLWPEGVVGGLDGKGKAASSLAFWVIDSCRSALLAIGICLSQFWTDTRDGYTPAADLTDH